MEPSNDQFSQSFRDGGRIRGLQLLLSVPVRRTSDSFLLRLIGSRLRSVGFHGIPHRHDDKNSRGRVGMKPEELVTNRCSCAAVVFLGAHQGARRRARQVTRR